MIGLIKDLIPQLLELDMTKIYDVEVKEHKEKRTVYQNRFLWGIIHKIGKESGMDDYEVYLTVLERADVKSVYIDCPCEMEKELRMVWRGVEFISRINNTWTYKVYFGSSKLNTKEMSDLIEVAMHIAAEYGIYYE